MKGGMNLSWVSAGFVILAWGVTFANTRALLRDFSALEIQLLRFALAWRALLQAAFVVRHAEEAPGPVHVDDGEGEAVREQAGRGQALLLPAPVRWFDRQASDCV